MTKEGVGTAAAGGGSTEIERAGDPAGTIRDLLAKNRNAIEAALPQVVTVDRFIRIALTTVQRNPRLLRADGRSLLGAIVEAAQLGLIVDNVLGEAYLVPFWDKNSKKYLVVMMPGYRGFIKLAHRSGGVSAIFARVVYENEPFRVIHGMETKIQHKPMPPGERGERVVAAYAVARLKDGTYQPELMWEDEIMAIRARSRAKDEGPWVTYTDEMRKKTVLRRLAKNLPLSTEWSRAAALDEAREAGVEVPTDYEVEVQASEALRDFLPPEEITEPKEKAPADEQKAGALPKGAARRLVPKQKGNKDLGTITEEQHAAIFGLLNRSGIKGGADVRAALGILLSVEVTDERQLSGAEAAAVIEALQPKGDGDV
jgi:recombination protein RecT